MHHARVRPLTGVPTAQDKDKIMSFLLERCTLERVPIYRQRGNTKFGYRIIITDKIRKPIKAPQRGQLTA